MADAQRTIDLVFNGIDKTGAATQAVLRNARSTTETVGNITGPVSDVTKKLVAFEGALLATGAGLTAFAVKLAGDFDQSFREISTLVDLPADALADFREQTKDLVAESAFPQLDNLTALYNAISAGVTDTSEALDTVRASERLAIAGNADLNDSLRVVVSTLNAYNLGAEEAGRISDVLFTTVKNGQTTLPELASQLSQVTGTAATLNIPFETLTAAIAALTATGTPTAQAVTQINAVLTNLLKPSKEAEEVASDLGIAFGAQAVQSRGLETVLADVEKATGGNAETMAQLFGSAEALRAVFPLTGNAAQAFADNIRDAENAAGATEEAFSKMADAVGLSNQRVINALRATFIEAGEPLLDEYGGIAEAIAAIFRALADNFADGALRDITAKIEELGQDAEAVLRRIAQNLPEALSGADLSGFGEGVQTVIDAVTGLFEGIDLTTAEGLRNVIEGIARGFMLLSEFTAGVVESFGPLVRLIIDAAGSASELDADFASMAGNIGGIATQVNAALPLLEALLGILIVKEGAGLAGAAVTAATNLGKLSGVLSGAGKAGLVGAAGSAGFAIGSVLAPGIDKLVNGLTDSEQSLGTFVFELIHGSEEAEQFAQSTARAGEALTAIGPDGLLIPQRIAEEWAAAAEGVSAATASLDTGIKDVTDSSLRVVEDIDQLNKLVDAGAVSVDDYLRTWRFAGDEIVEANRRGTTSVQDFDQNILTLEQSLGTLRAQAPATFDETADSALKAAEASEDFRLRMAELASDERIANIEARVDIDTARLEADTERVKAAFSSIDNTVNSTGDLISDLFGELTELSDQASFFDSKRSEQNRVVDQIEEENRRRDDALRLQRRLTEAQITNLRAQTERLSRGDALIEVDGAGLQPHLEAFMFEILRTIQTRVNADGLDMLLGV